MLQLSYPYNQHLIMLSQTALRVNLKASIEKEKQKLWSSIKSSSEEGTQRSVPKNGDVCSLGKLNVWEYNGTFRNGEFEEGQLVLIQRGITYIGKFKDGTYHGDKSQLTHEPPNKDTKFVYSDCTFERGYPISGTRSIFKKNSDAIYSPIPISKYTGQFLEWKFHGMGLYEEPGKCQYRGEFQNNMFHGFGKLTFYGSLEKQKDSWVMEGQFEYNQFVEGTHRVLEYKQPLKQQDRNYQETLQILEAWKKVIPVAPQPEDWDPPVIIEKEEDEWQERTPDRKQSIPQTSFERRVLGRFQEYSSVAG